MVSRFYSEEDRDKYLNELNKLGVDIGKIETNPNPNISVRSYRNPLNNEYIIKINKAHYICCGYEEIRLTIPAPTVLTTLGKVWNGIAITVDIAATLLGEDAFLPVAGDENDVVEILVIRLVDSYNIRVIDIISDEDREKVILAMKRSKRQCIELLGDGTTGMQILNAFYDENSAIGVSVENLYSIKRQFTEQDNEQEQHRQEVEAQRRAKKEQRRRTIYNDIIADFDRLELLQHQKLSNGEKLKEYSELKKFCSKYIPLLSDRSFRVESLLENYSKEIQKDACLEFKENWVRISRSHSVLSRGVNGEKKVYEVLQLFDDRIRVLRDYVWGHEHDFIVISPYGISTIEVKNLRGDYMLTETGVLKCLSSDRVKPKDVALQSKKHLETLRRHLRGCSAFSDKVPLQEIICSAESGFTIKDNYHHIPVCYYNTVDKVLFPTDGKTVLNDKAINAIGQYLLENQQEPFKFDVFRPRGEINSRAEFIKSFAEVASGLIIAEE